MKNFMKIIAVGQFGDMQKAFVFLRKFYTPFLSIILILSLSFSVHNGFCEELQDTRVLDMKVKMFLKNSENNWHDWNVPYTDGKVLYDLILKNKYRKALEIGTSTGLSAIWISWALSKTGGRLITIEIDEERYNQALANFKKTGLSEYCRKAHVAFSLEITKYPTVLLIQEGPVSHEFLR